jgi:hypothetical protein
LARKIPNSLLPSTTTCLGSGGKSGEVLPSRWCLVGAAASCDQWRFKDMTRALKWDFKRDLKTIERGDLKVNQFNKCFRNN